MTRTPCVSRLALWLVRHLRETWHSHLHWATAHLKEISLPCMWRQWSVKFRYFWRTVHFCPFFLGKGQESFDSESSLLRTLTGSRRLIFCLAMFSSVRFERWMITNHITTDNHKVGQMCLIPRQLKIRYKTKVRRNQRVELNDDFIALYPDILVERWD